MLICHPCRKEMLCEKTGSTYAYCDGQHYYSADTYRCPDCGSMTAKTGIDAKHLTPEQVVKARKNLGEWFVDMKG